MRISALVLGFAFGAVLMWQVAAPIPVPPPAPVVPVARPQAPALRVVLYDPSREASPRIYAARRAGPDGLTAFDRLDAPAQPAGFHIVGLDRSDSRGVCAVLDGETLRCLPRLTRAN